MARKPKEFTYKGVSTKEVRRWPTREDRAISNSTPEYILKKDWDMGNNIGFIATGGYFLEQVNGQYAVYNKNNNRSHVSVTWELLNEIKKTDSE
jgi:hypothetical protein